MDEVADLDGLSMPWLKQYIPQYADLVYTGIALLLIVVISVAIHWLLHRVVITWVGGRARQQRRVWRRAFFERKLFSRFALMLQGIIIYIQAGLWLELGSFLLPLVQTLLLPNPTTDLAAFHAPPL